MLAKFSDFLGQNLNCKKFTDDEDMINAFNFLSQDFIIMQLLEASEAGKPAITPIVENIEHIFADSSKEHLNTLDDNFTKQAVGLMIKTILAPFGYTVWKQKDLPKKSGATKFQSASTYRFDPLAPRTMRVVKRIEEINKSCKIEGGGIMQNWNLIRPVAEQILRQQRYTSSGNYNGEPCFITAYQLSVLIDAQNPSLKGDLSLGGTGKGPDSFARQIAWHLSDDVNKNEFNGSLEIQFLSIAGLDSFTFGGGHAPSSNEFSMFRLT